MPQQDIATPEWNQITTFDNDMGDNSSDLPITYSITSILNDKFWTNFRAFLANSLILETTISPEYAYWSVFNTFPDEGNCWCYLDKTSSSAKKGSPQDDYDNTCRHYHNCLHCGSFKEGAEAGEILNQGLDTEFTIDITNVGSFIPEYVHSDYTNLFGYG